MNKIEKLITEIKTTFKGEIYTDRIHKILYSTDASVYKETPLAVTIPKDKSDIHQLIKLANKYKLPIIPRAAGTSLAGQVVGKAIIADISKNFKKIIAVNNKEKWVRVQPGVNLDELNLYLKEHNLFFGPETSTSNRCLIGGMIGNNSCGSHSIIYGSTRDNLLEVTTFLSDGSEVIFKELTKEEFYEKCKTKGLEGEIYSNINNILSDTKNQAEIIKEYPSPTINRRNTGYAIDVLMEAEVFSNGNKKFNFCNLIAGSEGTLAFITEIKLNCVELPKQENAVICIHCNSIEAAFEANLIALKQKPSAVEMIDKYILDCTKTNITQRANRFFIEGDPEALLVVELNCDTKEEILEKAEKIESEMKEQSLAYAFPILFGDDIKKVWNLRKAGLGLLSNIPGDKKPVAVIEDTAVDVEVLPQFMSDFKKKLDYHNLNCVVYAHIGSGELHLRPILNLKEEEDIKLFRIILEDIAKLVKKYKGSLCGEHGTGRLRGEFIPMMIGENNYKLLEEIKITWDKNNIFNPNKIINTPRMTDNLRFVNAIPDNFETSFDFSNTSGFIRGLEKCNGSGDCRKSTIIGGTMCPTFQVSGNEILSTRGRANLLREVYYSKNAFKDKDLYEMLNYCLSCKACKSECPSNVDMSKLKAEFLQQYYLQNRIPLRTLAIAYISKINSVASLVPSIYNAIMSQKIIAKTMMRFLDFSTKREMPSLYKYTLNKFIKKELHNLNPKNHKKEIVFFNDEFTNYNDTEIGTKAIKLLTSLGYKINFYKHKESGRTYLSKGLINMAKKIANKNIKILSSKVSSNIPLVGIEPSTILTFRDEYLDLATEQLKEKASSLAKNSFTIDEFLANEIDNGNIKKSQFTNEVKNIKFHCHCQQKAIANSKSLDKILSFPENYKAEEIKSGCCGMAGSYGFEKEHYDISMEIGEMVLFPEVRKSDPETYIAASGTSCRHQIKDGTGKHAKHPVEILYEALKIQ